MNALRTSMVLAALAVALEGAHAAPATIATPTLGNQAPVMCFDTVLAKGFAPNFADGTVSVIDTATPRVTATVEVGPNPRRVLCNEATHRVYVVNATTPGTVTVLNATNDAVVTTIPVGNEPRFIAGNLLIDELYVSNFGSGTVSVIDTNRNAVVATVAVGPSPLAPQSNDRLKKLYVPSSVDGTVSVIDQRTHAVTATIKVGNPPQFAIVDGRHGKVYVNNVPDRTVSVIDSATDTVIKTLPTGSGTSANFGVVNGVYRRYYLPNATDRTLTVIDTDADVVVKTLPVGATPVDVLADAGTGDLYVVNQGANSVTVINAGTETVIGSFAVGTGPQRIYESGDRVYVLNANGANRDTLTVSTKQNTIADTVITTEFYHAAFNHYFHTADETETSLIRDGLFDDNWHRTFEFWRVWSAPGAGRVPVCRFFSATFAPRSSHFYTPYPAECPSLQTGGTWSLESPAVYYLMMPDANGQCPAATVPLYRVYNNSLSGAPNHRYLIDRALRNQMLVQGWTAEGGGVDIVFACMPTISGN